MHPFSLALCATLCTGTAFAQSGSATTGPLDVELQFWTRCTVFDREANGNWYVSMSPNLRRTLFHPARLPISACADIHGHAAGVQMESRRAGRVGCTFKYGYTVLVFAPTHFSHQRPSFALGFIGSHMAHDGQSDICHCNACSLNPIAPP